MAHLLIEQRLIQNEQIFYLVGTGEIDIHHKQILKKIHTHLHPLSSLLHYKFDSKVHPHHQLLFECIGTEQWTVSYLQFIKKHITDKLLEYTAYTHLHNQNLVIYMKT